MEIVSIELLRQHLRMEPDETEQDAMLEEYIRGAAGLIEGHCNTTFDCIIKQYGEVPSQLKVAVMQIAAHWYRHPEAATQATLSMCPAATVAIINKFKKSLPHA